MEEEEDTKEVDTTEIREPRTEAEPEKEKIRENSGIIGSCIGTWKTVMTGNYTGTNPQVEEYMIPADPDLLTENPEALPDTEVPHHQPDWSEEEVCTGISALEED